MGHRLGAFEDGVTPYPVCKFLRKIHLWGLCMETSKFGSWRPILCANVDDHLSLGNLGVELKQVDQHLPAEAHQGWW